MTDPIVEEIHKIRQDLAAKFDYDIDAIFEDLRQKQLESNRKIVSFVKDTKNRKHIDDKKVA